MSERHADLPKQEADVALGALAEALKTCFGLLKGILLVLAIFFCFSGSFNVTEGQVAVRVRLGALPEDLGRQVVPPGGPYFSFPEPIDRIVFLPTTEQQLSLDRTFWFEVAEGDRLKPLDELHAPPGGLVPGKDGFLLTGDRNIVHGQWTVTYKIDPARAALFVRNVGAREGAGKGAGDAQEAAAHLLRPLAEQAIVHVCAQISADAFVNGNIPRDRAKELIQRRLDELETGLIVTDLLLTSKTPPLAARSAFLDVIKAESQKSSATEAARLEASRILSDWAGPQPQAVVAALEECERAKHKTKSAAHTESEQALEHELQSESERALEQLLTSDRAGRKVSELMYKARTYRTQVEKAIQGEAARFESLLPQYRENPSLVRSRLRQEAFQQIFAGDVEKFYLPEGTKEIYLDLNRDPEVQRKKETERYQKVEKK